MSREDYHIELLTERIADLESEVAYYHRLLVRFADLTFTQDIDGSYCGEPADLAGAVNRMLVERVVT
ncbi:MAG: hypothetical protein M9941_19810 [Anaerolineae bacterium]|nr:hypothetical protein [Anaerolineae bacterium]MCO5195454.1 hypothetical protein [Anaerolineae bacterium]MCO5199988.1 hypothetical protein [Anaerolineae bacterium]